jgi:hypothetical protein
MSERRDDGRDFYLLDRFTTEPARRPMSNHYSIFTMVWLFAAFITFCIILYIKVVL